MYTINRTEVFSTWLAGLKDLRAREGRTVYLLLTGGDKSSQKRDIDAAIAIWKQIQEEQP